MPNHWRLSLRPDDRHHIEPRRRLRKPVARQEQLRRLADLVLLEFVHLLLRRRIVVRARLDLDENQRLSIPRDDVHLAPFDLEIPRQQLVSQRAAHVPRRDVLPLIAQRVLRLGGAGNLLHQGLETPELLKPIGHVRREYPKRYQVFNVVTGGRWLRSSWSLGTGAATQRGGCPKSVLIIRRRFSGC